MSEIYSNVQPWDDQPDDSCPVCGSSMGWEDCWECFGEGDYHDCGEDVCCCLEPDFDERHGCPECGGKGGYLVCINVQNHRTEAGP